MTVVKINAVTVSADSGDELARRFAARAGAVDDQDGFEGFELLKPTDERTVWLVVTLWRDNAIFEAWLRSPAFGHGHRAAADRGAGAAPGPVGVSSELWSYEVAGGSPGLRRMAGGGCRGAGSRPGHGADRPGAPARCFAAGERNARVSCFAAGERSLMMDG